MTETINKQETWGGMDISYRFNVSDGGVSAVSVTANRKMEGCKVRMTRHYLRDMSYTSAQSAQILSDEENAHIAEVVSSIWEQYPDIVVEIDWSQYPDVEHEMIEDYGIAE